MDGSAYVLNLTDNSMSRIRNALQLDFPGSLPSSVSAMVVDPATSTAYLLEPDIKMVQEVLYAGQIGDEPMATGSALSIGAKPRHSHALRCKFGGHTVSVFDLARHSNSVVAVGSEPVAIAVNPVTSRVYVANAGDQTISVIDGSTNTVSSVFDVGTDLTALAVNQPPILSTS